ncbi:MAG: heavy metal-binding domain-containing protein [Saprospiraceae bacterium]
MKSFKFLFFLMFMSLVIVSCEQNKSTSVDNSLQQPNDSNQEIAHIDYVCPMDCEKGKVYHEMGKCPECKMDLIQKAHTSHDGHEHHEGDGHDHKKEDGHDHKEGDGHDHKDEDKH